MSYVIQVVYRNGDVSYVCDGIGQQPRRFQTKAAAKQVAAFARMGFDEDEVQSVSVIKEQRT